MENQDPQYVYVPADSTEELINSSVDNYTMTISVPDEVIALWNYNKEVEEKPVQMEFEFMDPDYNPARKCCPGCDCKQWTSNACNKG